MLLLGQVGAGILYFGKTCLNNVSSSASIGEPIGAGLEGEVIRSNTTLSTTGGISTISEDVYICNSEDT